MLSKYPGLTLVSGLAMGFAVMVGAGTFEFVIQVMNPTIPLDDGDRIVGIQVWNVAENEADAPTIYDLVRWPEELRSMEVRYVYFEEVSACILPTRRALNVEPSEALRAEG
ncbi:MAG TPA: hypothetical protein VFI91_02820 [Longimicrobiaceae bacterium]|nr:hypothetical protein [Longimicrobiaceae bacterium]